MPGRDSLHALVDTLPDEAVESIERILQHHHKWPPRGPIDAAKLHEQVRERFKKFSEEHPLRSGGSISGSSGGGSLSAEGDARVCITGWEGDTLVKVEHRVFRGQRLEIEERLHISDNKQLLLYSQNIKGPAGKTVLHEAEFALREND